MLRWGHPMHLMWVSVPDWVRHRLSIRWANRDYAIVTEVVVDVLELEAWDELIE